MQGVDLPQTWAILSDIHGNIDALEAVLRDLDQQPVDRLLVLGDLINYGAAPVACVERVVTMADIIILGNHEQALLGEIEGMNGAAGAGLGWTGEQLASSEVWRELIAEARFPQASRQVVDGVELVHGSPRDPVLEYVWPGNTSYFRIFNRQIDERLLQILEATTARHCLCGHTHIPAALLRRSKAALLEGIPCQRSLSFSGQHTMFFVPDGPQLLTGLSAVSVILNPGSVGQPRDGDPRAAYAIYDGDTFSFRRVEYDIPTAQQRIRALPIEAEAREWLAARLEKGV